MSLKRCLKYIHTVKRCGETIITCVRCCNQGHRKDKCTSTEVRFSNCVSDHQAFLGNCLIIIKKTSSYKQKNAYQDRLKDIQKLLILNEIPELKFSNTVKSTSNPFRSKSPTTSEKGSRSDSSQNTKVTLKFFDNFGNERDNSPTVVTYGHGYFTEIKGKKKTSLPSPPLT